LMYTSGTTGAPKGALLPHRKSLYNSLNAAEYFANSKDDRVLVVAPLFHSLGLQILAVPMVHAGGALLLHRQFDPERVWEAVERERITYLGGVPSMYQRLEDVLAESSPGRWQHPDLRFAFTAGSAASVELIRSFEARGIQLQQGYGQTETSILTCLSAAEALDRAGSVGRPVSHGEVRVVERKPYPRDPQRWRDTNPGEVGEIVVRGAITMLGYWEQPEASAQVLIQDWLCTGDLATRDSDGYLTLVGRKGDMFISGGENVYPAEVEAVYREHPAIREIAILGVPHLEWGEVGRAHLVLEPGEELDEAALHSWARERLAPFKLPRDYVLEEELPRTASGKIRKQLLTGRP
ncbi:MAG: AMP-binding protein, partial [Myxococcota bacterium]